jgi:hypothetical protein
MASRDKIKVGSINVMFESVVVVVFQIIFRVKIHQNNIFLFFKKLFLTSAHQNNLKTLKTY